MRAIQGLASCIVSTVRELLHGDDGAPPEPGPERPIILLQGFAASSAVLLPLQRHLESRLGRPVVRLRLGGRLPLHLKDVRSSALAVHRALQKMAEAPEFEYADVVGHSLGGLVATYLLKRLDRGRHVRRVVTLGTPHSGTPLAALGVALVGAVNRVVWQMLPGAPLLRALARIPVPSGSSVLAVTGPDDAIVPPTYAALEQKPRQTNLLIPGLSHFDFLQAPAFAHICAALKDDRERRQVDELPVAA